MGCYRDTSSRAIRSLEGSDAILDGSYSSRVNPIAKCTVAAMKAGYSMFAVQNGGWCAAGATAPRTFNMYEKSTACTADGEMVKVDRGPIKFTLKVTKGGSCRTFSHREQKESYSFPMCLSGSLLILSHGYRSSGYQMHFMTLFHVMDPNSMKAFVVVVSVLKDYNF